MVSLKICAETPDTYSSKDTIPPLRKFISASSSKVAIQCRVCKTLARDKRHWVQIRRYLT